MTGLNAGLTYRQRNMRDLGVATPSSVQVGTGVITAYVAARRMPVSATGQPLSVTVTGRRLAVTVAARQ